MKGYLDYLKEFKVHSNKKGRVKEKKLPGGIDLNNVITDHRSKVIMRKNGTNENNKGPLSSIEEEFI